MRESVSNGSKKSRTGGSEMKIKITVSITVTEEFIELCEQKEGMDGAMPEPWKMYSSCITLSDHERIHNALVPFLSFGREYGKDEKNSDYKWDQDNGSWVRIMKWTPTKRMNMKRAKAFLAVLKPLQVSIDYEVSSGLLQRGSGRIQRERLFNHVKEHGGDVAVRNALRQIAVRSRDPMRGEARKILASWGEDISSLIPKERTTPTSTG